MNRSTLFSCFLSLALLNGCGIKSAETQVLADPESASSWIALGDAYKKAHKNKKARSAYEKALQLEPENIIALQAISGTGRSQVKKLKRKALKDPTNDEIWGDLGDASLADGDRQSALNYYSHALRLDNTDEEWIRRIVELGGQEAILEMMRKNIEDNPENDEVLGDYGDLLSQLGQNEEACLAYQKAAQIDPEDSEWGDHLDSCTSEGLVEVNQQSLDEILSSRLKENPNDPDIMMTIGDTLLESGDRAGALEMFNRALTISPASDGLIKRVVALSGEPMINLLIKLSQEYPTNDEVWGNLGDTYLQLNQNDQALSAYQKAKALDPSDTEWQQQVKLLEGKH